MLTQRLRPLEFLKSLRTQTNRKDTEVQSGREQGCGRHRAPPSGGSRDVGATGCLRQVRMKPIREDAALEESNVLLDKDDKEGKKAQAGTPPVSNSETNISLRTISSNRRPDLRHVQLSLLLPILCQ